MQSSRLWIEGVTSKWSAARASAARRQTPASPTPSARSRAIGGRRRRLAWQAASAWRAPRITRPARRRRIAVLHADARSRRSAVTTSGTAGAVEKRLARFRSPTRCRDLIETTVELRNRGVQKRRRGRHLRVGKIDRGMLYRAGRRAGTSPSCLPFSSIWTIRIGVSPGRSTRRARSSRGRSPPGEVISVGRVRRRRDRTARERLWLRGKRGLSGEEKSFAHLTKKTRLGRTLCSLCKYPSSKPTTSASSVRGGGGMAPSTVRRRGRRPVLEAGVPWDVEKDSRCRRWVLATAAARRRRRPDRPPIPRVRGDRAAGDHRGEPYSGRRRRAVLVGVEVAAADAADSLRIRPQGATRTRRRDAANRRPTARTTNPFRRPTGRRLRASGRRRPASHRLGPCRPAGPTMQTS